jgi:hypothetical protein
MIGFSNPTKSFDIFDSGIKLVEKSGKCVVNGLNLEKHKRRGGVF